MISIPFFKEGEDAAFCPFLDCILFIDTIAKSNFFVIHISGGISSRLAAFLLVTFVSITLNSSPINCPILIMLCFSTVPNLKERKFFGKIRIDPRLNRF